MSGVFSRDTRHLWIVVLLLVGAGIGGFVIRHQLTPETYGDKQGRYGPYRAAALAELSAKPMKLQPDEVCLECHAEVEEKRAEGPHTAVRCVHCHGPANVHVDEARAAKATPGSPLTPPQPWDGDFLSDIDLYTTDNKVTCLSCHETVVGMPEDFKQIVFVDHLDEVEPEEPESEAVCLECHYGHSPVI